MMQKLEQQQQEQEAGSHTQLKAGGVVYYDTELKFSPQRLLEIILARYPSTATPSTDASARIFSTCDNSLGLSPSLAEVLLRRVSVRRPLTCGELIQDLQQLEATGHLVSEGISLVGEGQEER